MCEDQSRSHQPQREPNGDEANSTGDPGSHICRRLGRGCDAGTSAAPRLVARYRWRARLSGDVDGGRGFENPEPCPGVVDAHRGQSRRLARDVGGREGTHGMARSVVGARRVWTCRSTANHRDMAGQRQGFDAEDVHRHAAADHAGADRRHMAQGTGVGNVVARWIAVDVSCPSNPLLERPRRLRRRSVFGRTSPDLP
jgi:hypothetical protein